MSQKRRFQEYHDPDYHTQAEKKLKVSPEDKSLKILEIIKKQFQIELEDREKEAVEIENRLSEAKKQLDNLKYVAVSSFYRKGEISKFIRENSETLEEESLGKDQISLHPAIKKLVGKTPKRYSELVSAVPTRRAAQDAVSLFRRVSKTKKEEKSSIELSRNLEEPEESGITRLNSSRGRNQEKHLIVVGNTSKYIGENKLNSSVSHKWLVYVKTRSHQPIEKLVRRIRFFLHPTYQPNDCVDIDSPPFKISRFGWGEFTIRVQLHFHLEMKQKPIQIFHRVKLDERRTGLETLGAETVAELWLNRQCQDIEDTRGIPEDFPAKFIQEEPMESLKLEIREFQIKDDLDFKEKPSWTSDFASHFIDHSYSRIHRQTGEDRLTKVFNSISFTAIRAAVEFLLRRLPLISPITSDFPFVTTQNVYNKFHWAKRSSNEWFRAKFISRLLRKHSRLRDLEMWSTKEIVIFARNHLYTPSVSSVHRRPLDPSKQSLKDFLKEEIKWEKFPDKTTTNSLKISNWISNHQVPLKKIPEKELDILIDIEETEKAEKTKRFCDSSSNKPVLWTLEDVLCRKSTDDDEKEVKDVMQIVLKTFLEDLVRRSAANVIGDSQIQTIHVKSALMSRKEFDFLTNQSLGRTS